MSENRGQGDVFGAVVGAIVVAIFAFGGIYLLSEFSQTISITGTFAGTGEDVLIGATDALVLAAGGSGLAVTALLILRGVGR